MGVFGIGLAPACPGSAFAQAIDTTLWVANAEVYAVTREGQTIYIGGGFSQVGPATGGLVVLDPATGVPQTPYPKVNGAVIVMAPDGTGGWYVGGGFNSVQGQPRNNLAHLDASGVLTAWNPNPNGGVNALVVDGGIVYVGGEFTTIGGQARARVAAIDASTGLATSWNPSANAAVHALEQIGGTLYARGIFTVIGGQARNSLAALDMVTGTATGWDPNPNGQVYSLAVGGGTVYVGGHFTSVGGQARSHVAALDPTSGAATAWNPSASDFVQSLLVNGSTIYAGGGFFTIGGQARSKLAALDAISGNATSWNPGANDWVSALSLSGGILYVGGAFTSAGGQARNRLAAIDVVTGLATSWNPAPNEVVYTVAAGGGVVRVGGRFTSVGGVSRSRIAALDAVTGAPTSWNPNSNDWVFALAVRSGTVYAGGRFSSIGGQSRQRIAAIDASTGSATSWNPDVGGYGGDVYSLAIGEGVVYAGGAFTTVGGQARNRIAAIDAVTGVPTGWNPDASGIVWGLAVGSSTIYAGGEFTSIGGQVRNYVAALDPATGGATSWNPNPSFYVFALAAAEGAVYAGGAFSSIGGQARNRIAALDPTTGAATGWNPSASNTVYALAASGPTIYAAGFFETIGGGARKFAAALDAVTGMASSWNPRPYGGLRSLAVHGPRVVLGGNFTSVGSTLQSHVVAVRSSPALSGIEPASGGNAGPVTVTVFGSGLATGDTLKLVRSGQPTIIAGAVVATSDATSATGTFDLSGAVTGPWDVVLIAPDGQSTVLQNGFSIEVVLGPQLRVALIGPTLQGGNFAVRRDRRTAYDLVIENPGNVDAVSVPLWLAGIPLDATVEPDFSIGSPPQSGGEPDWSTVPLTFTTDEGKYLPVVIPRIPPGTTTRRVYVTVPGPTHDPFTVTAAVTPPWVDGTSFRSCLAGGGVTNLGCVGTQMNAINAFLLNSSPTALSGTAFWAKVAWHCLGAGTLGAAQVKAEEVLDYLEGPVEGGFVAGECEGVITPRWREVMTVLVVGAIDPNDKLGVQGTISGQHALPYSIRFENFANATAPAQQVTISDPLDPSKLEVNTLSLDVITFGDVQIHPPPGLKSYSTRVDLRPAKNLLVDVAASLDPFTNVLSWYFTSIDPATGEVPQSFSEGFLPPNVTPPDGEGSVLFTVMPKAGLSEGTMISNAASILFDDPPATLTPIWSNGVDFTPPASRVLPMTPQSHQPSITVSWLADGYPPDLRDFTIYVNQDGGPYRVWRLNTPVTSDTLMPPPDRQFHTFSFYSVARDMIGNIEAAPGTPDATTQSTTGVDATEAPRLSLAGAWPNPVSGPLSVGLTLPDDGPATLELLDIAGRRRLRRQVGSLGPGSHVMTLEPERPLAPGLYFLRLVRGGEILRARVAVIGP